MTRNRRPKYRQFHWRVYKRNTDFVFAVVEPLTIPKAKELAKALYFPGQKVRFKLEVAE